MGWEKLLRGELILTLNIVVGLSLGTYVLRHGIARRLMKLLSPLLNRVGIAPDLGLALGVSLGSSRAGASLLASSLGEGRITRRTAKWGTLMLAFPAYLHRWPSTMILAAGMAGLPGSVFAMVLLLRSAARFVMLTAIARGGNSGSAVRFDAADAIKDCDLAADLVKRLKRTLPLAWLFYAAAFTAVPYAESFLRNNLGGYSILPLAGWTVAAASISHVSASLALAGGSLGAGELTAAQAVFALLLGNSLGIVTRAVRQNAAFYFGLFPKDLAREMLLLNIATQTPFVIITLLAAALPLLAAK